MSSTFAGRVSPVIAKSKLETDPPDAVTVPVIVVGVVPEPEPDHVPDPVPEPVPVPEPEPEPPGGHVVPPDVQPEGAAWHLLDVRSQYHPP